jgi:hypothetical protein
MIRAVHRGPGGEHEHNPVTVIFDKVTAAFGDRILFADLSLRLEGRTDNLRPRPERLRQINPAQTHRRHRPFAPCRLYLL